MRRQATRRFEGRAAALLGARHRQEVGGEIVAVVLGLKADKVIVRQGAENLVVVRQRT